ncbi:transcriptional regulator of aroF, aroG, tyrA and aromatic amino acid transport [Clostridium tetanomorphum]|uniref:HTH-type transcriptional regulatory protein TyrR n=1 Tax=Clostridium tetanomorphum TaxID=1553 RepID=A0A923IYH7_CLOTT|nr:sigma 54-interacting transcriptional regulator [Clostridium tetanomorphum]KAJ51392.1 transcriptional regulator [Clostridium tetanomorphum DSM 665]MBC2396401.1 sigma 54-interacting transcriptional regulator [Clostridium tetanomorphum]MBP1863369.1 transcriptional regulator of aroF, aroG, tyrA and aromatic amino acid transport [Clostridium tetanomorphum]NRS83466.1 transcriptional regulator of aroF, aroG, tyrA and aromatic amino acid transport [Clostridium tetanomorphum]NRZ96666.1 transcription
MGKNYFRFEIITKDRIGITLEILDKIYKLNINLVSLEVFPKKVYVKIKDITKDQKLLLKHDLYNINGVVFINEIELLEHEKHERKLLAIIDSIDDGIIYINKNMEIEIFNSYCEEIFHYTREDVIGQNAKNIVKDAPMVELLNSGEKYDNIEVNIESSRGKLHYLTTGRPVKDDNGNNIGVVASVKDMKKAIEMANVLSNADKDNGAFKEIIGNSLSMEKVKGMIRSVAKSNSTIILRGESGTGKELFAKAVYNLSGRKDKSFIPINCAALPENLIESELFGYEKGSFTGAVSTKEGLFKEAHNGTLFLDEVGELPLVLQAKLLRVLQEGVIRKIGCNKEEKVDVRIICATNRNLEHMVQNGEFREDLYYRLNVIPIYIPPLRQHLEDIPILVTYFIEKLNKKLSKNILGTDLEFINELIKYNWPGNIRELENVVERAMNLCNQGFLRKEHLMIDVYNPPKIIDKIDRLEDMKLKDIVDIAEKEAIIKALKKHKTFRKTAKALGVSHTTIINKSKKLGIKWNQ